MVFRGNRRMLEKAVDHLTRFSTGHAKHASVVAQIVLVVDMLMNLLMLGLSIWAFSTTNFTTTSTTTTTTTGTTTTATSTETTTAPAEDLCNMFVGDGDHKDMGVPYSILASGFLVAAAAEYYFDFLAVFQRREPECSKTFDVNFSLFILSGVVFSQSFAETEKLPGGFASVLEEVVRVQACLFFIEVFLSILDLNPVSAFLAVYVAVWALQYDLSHCTATSSSVVIVLWLFTCFNAVCIDRRRYQPGFWLLEFWLPFACIGILVANFFLLVWAAFSCGFWLFGYTDNFDNQLKPFVAKLYSRNSIIKRSSLIESKDHIFVSTMKSNIKAARAHAHRCWSVMAADAGEASKGGEDEEERAGSGDAEAPTGPGEEEEEVRRPRAAEDALATGGVAEVPEQIDHARPLEATRSCLSI